MIGTEILHYKIIEKLGEGGMGVVYKAEDTKLNRNVAIKILPPHLLVAQEDRARFSREAKAAAALNHSNIATVYEINETEEKPFIVMEYVEGQTLDKIVGAHSNVPLLPLKDIISITIQIAEGLQAAHKKDIVHRDIKASNILLSTEKQAKILDFGLAKTSISTKLTQMGTTIGTVAYMSPEQVRGEEVDHRTDLWSLGVLLYEIIAGRLPFKADYDQAIFYSIQNEDPEPLTAIRTGVPMSLEWIVNKLMAKDPDERYQSAKDLIIDLKAVDLNTSGFSRISKTRSATQNITQKPLPVTTKPGRQLPRITIYISASILLVLLSAILGWNLKPLPESDKSVRKFMWPEEYDLIEISPDGNKLAYTQNRNFWVRSFDHLEPARIETNDFIQTPLAWAPNSDEIAFYINSGSEQRQLRKASAGGGQSVLISNYPASFRLCYWGTDDSLVFVNNNTTFYKISSNGGDFKPMYHGDTTLCNVNEGLETAYRLPGRDAMVLTVNTGESSTIFVQNESARKTVYRFPPEFDVGEAVYDKSGYIIFHRFEGSRINHPDLWAIPFDLSAVKNTGEPFLITTSAGWPDVTENGTLFHSKQVLNTSGSEKLVILNRNGIIIDSLGQKLKSINNPNLSPDGTEVVVSGDDGNSAGIWLQDINNRSSLFIQDAQNTSLNWPVFTKDGQYLYFSRSDGQESWYIYKQLVNGLGEAQRINNSDYIQYSAHLSRSNRYILIEGKKSSDKSIDIFYQEEGQTELQDLLTADYNEMRPSLSPDEHYMVFESMKNGQLDVYLTRFPDSRVQRQVSVNGGGRPLWIGNEIFYVTRENNLMVVDVNYNDGNISIDRPYLLFSGNQAGIRLYGNYSYKYTVKPGGREIIAVHSPQALQYYYVLIENWIEEFKQKQ